MAILNCHLHIYRGAIDAIEFASSTICAVRISFIRWWNVSARPLSLPIDASSEQKKDCLFIICLTAKRIHT